MRFSRENAQVLRDHRVKILEKDLNDWFCDMRRSPCRCGEQTPHCCPFSVIHGEVDFGIDLLGQLLIFKQLGLLHQPSGCVRGTATTATQTVQEYCSSARSDDWPNGMLMPTPVAHVSGTSKTRKRRLRRKMQKSARANADLGNGKFGNADSGLPVR